jgi:hypothetical protein
VVTWLVQRQGSGGDAASTRRRWSLTLVHAHLHAFVHTCPCPCAPSFTSTPTCSFVPASICACPRSHPPAFIPVSIGSRILHSPFVMCAPACWHHPHPSMYICAHLCLLACSSCLLLCHYHSRSFSWPAHVMPVCLFMLICTCTVTFPRPCFGF